MTQARELSCLHVRLEETGDQKGETLTPGITLTLVFPFRGEPGGGLALEAPGSQAGGGVGGRVHMGLSPLVLRRAVAGEVHLQRWPGPQVRHGGGGSAP